MHAWVFIADAASWYSMQKMQVCWDKSLSEPFSVSNGVRQGSVLSPHLFAVYIDRLLLDLCDSGVGCYWGCSFVGAFSYADDLVLLAPCASALRLRFESYKFVVQFLFHTNLHLMQLKHS